MQLKEWLESKGISQTKMARTIGVTPLTVWRWCKGTRIPALRYAKEIVRYTKGKVSLRDLYDG